MNRLPPFASPLMLGFDAMENTLKRVAKGNDGYPPYNIERTGDNAYRITMAVAGFEDSELSIESRENVLTVQGERSEPEAEANRFLHRGIAGRAFERRFQLAEHVEVKGATLKNGLLHIDLVRIIPEAMKPRRIEIAIADNANAKSLEANAA
mgnify:CR=1 FL=1